MDNLDGITTGSYDIVTASGTSYRLDLDQKTATRHRLATAPVDDFESAELRKDGAILVLVRILRCEVGHGLNLILDNVDDYDGYGGTLRRGTAVVSITEAENETAAEAA